MLQRQSANGLSGYKPKVGDLNVNRYSRELRVDRCEESLPFALDAAGRRSDVDWAVQWLGAFAAKNSGAYDGFAYRKACCKNLEADSHYAALPERLKLP